MMMMMMMHENQKKKDPTIEGGGWSRRWLNSNILNQKVIIFRIFLDGWWKNHKFINSFRTKWVSMNRRTRTHITKSLFFWNNHNSTWRRRTLKHIKRVHDMKKKRKWSLSERGREVKNEQKSVRRRGCLALWQRCNKKMR